MVSSTSWMAALTFSVLESAWPIWSSVARRCSSFERLSGGVARDGKDGEVMACRRKMSLLLLCDVELSLTTGSIVNATLVGSPPLATGQHFGFVLQFGSRAVFKNSLIQGFADAAFDLRLSPNVLKNELGSGKNVDISHALLNANTVAYSEQAQGLSTMQSMRTQDPNLRAATNPTPGMPDAIPLFAPADPTVNTDPASAPMGFDATAGFRGGVPQDGPDWTLGWTSFPND